MFEVEAVSEVTIVKEVRRLEGADDLVGVGGHWSKLLEDKCLEVRLLRSVKTKVGWCSEYDVVELMEFMVFMKLDEDCTGAAFESSSFFLFI